MKGIVVLLMAMLSNFLAIGNPLDGTCLEDDNRTCAGIVRPFRGVWAFGENHEIVVQLESDGRGALKFVMADYLLSWTSDGNNVITCRIDPDFGFGRRRCVLPTDMRTFCVRYLPERKELELEPTGVFSGYFRGRRILQFTSGEPHVDELIKKDEECRRRDEEKRIAMEKEHLKNWSRETVTNRCVSFEMLLSVLSEDIGSCGRSVLVKTEVDGLNDFFRCDRSQGQVLFTAELDVGYVEVGPRPKNLEFRALVSESRIPRPDELPPPSKVCEIGIRELVESWHGAGSKVVTVSFLRIDGQWKDCCDRVLFNWRLEQAGFVKQALRARFADRFPCDIIISTICRKNRSN